VSWPSVEGRTFRIECRIDAQRVEHLSCLSCSGTFCSEQMFMSLGELGWVIHASVVIGERRRSRAADKR
jgi:hypothetical protein